MTDVKEVKVQLEDSRVEVKLSDEEVEVDQAMRKWKFGDVKVKLDERK